MEDSEVVSHISESERQYFYNSLENVIYKIPGGREFLGEDLNLDFEQLKSRASNFLSLKCKFTAAEHSSIFIEKVLLAAFTLAHEKIVSQKLSPFISEAKMKILGNQMRKSISSKCKDHMQLVSAQTMLNIANSYEESGKKSTPSTFNMHCNVAFGVIIEYACSTFLLMTEDKIEDILKNDEEQNKSDAVDGKENVYEYVLDTNQISHFKNKTNSESGNKMTETNSESGNKMTETNSESGNKMTETNSESGNKMTETNSIKSESKYIKEYLSEKNFSETNSEKDVSESNSINDYLSETNSVNESEMSSLEDLSDTDEDLTKTTKKRKRKLEKKMDCKKIKRSIDS